MISNKTRSEVRRIIRTETSCKSDWTDRSSRRRYESMSTTYPENIYEWLMFGLATSFRCSIVRNIYMDEDCVIVVAYGCSQQCRTSAVCALFGDLERFTLRTNPKGSCFCKEFQQHREVFFIAKRPARVIQYHGGRIIKR